jgi:hypothetical protein
VLALVCDSNSRFERGGRGWSSAQEAKGVSMWVLVVLPEYRLPILSPMLLSV